MSRCGVSRGWKKGKNHNYRKNNILKAISEMPNKQISAPPVDKALAGPGVIA